MLRFYLLSVFTIIAALPVARAQEFNGGFFAGATAAQVDGDSYSGYNKLGFTAGAFVNREIDYSIYWQLEIKYVTRGVYKGPSDNDPTLYMGSYHYIELPVSLHYLHDQKIQVEGGISPEILVYTVFSDQDGILDPAAYPDDLRRFGVSVFGGAYYWFSASAGLGLRYTYSAIPFRVPREWNHPRYRGYFHNVLCLTLAYRIGYE
jgi:hypothetical protein